MVASNGCAIATRCIDKITENIQCSNARNYENGTVGITSRIMFNSFMAMVMDTNAGLGYNKDFRSLKIL